MPRSRRSCLSRSNIRRNAASSSASYPGTRSRISWTVRNRRAWSRQMTRLSSRSVFLADMGTDVSLRPMIRWRRGTVSALGPTWSGAAELAVDVDGAEVRALAYPQLVGDPVVGDLVLLNMTALQLGL